MRPFLLACVAAVLLAAAATYTAASAVAARKPVGDEPDAAITDGSAQRALDAARKQWRAQKVGSYRLRVARSCFCPEEFRRPATVTVRRGRPVKPPQRAEDIASVTRLFRQVQRAIDAKAASLQVRYDTRRGFPRSISIDRSRLTADEEQYFTADRFRPLKG